jgi:hypothetical protein
VFHWDNPSEYERGGEMSDGWMMNGLCKGIHDNEAAKQKMAKELKRITEERTGLLGASWEELLFHMRDEDALKARDIALAAHGLPQTDNNRN